MTTECGNCGHVAPEDRVTCPNCGQIVHSFVKEYISRFTEKKKKKNEHYLVSGIMDSSIPSEIYQIYDNISIRKINREWLDVKTSNNGVIIENKIPFNDTYFKSDYTLTISVDDEDVKLTSFPPGCKVNGEVAKVGALLEPGDLIQATMLTSFKLETDLEEPVIFDKALNLIPPGFDCKEYEYKHNGKSYFNAISKDPSSFYGISVRTLSKKQLDAINMIILGEDYFSICRKLKR